MKFHNAAFLIDKKYYKHIKNYLARFQEIAGNKVVIHYIMITSNGIINNEYYRELVNTEITLSQLIK
jgi:hypothetical protein